MTNKTLNGASQPKLNSSTTVGHITFKHLFKELSNKKNFFILSSPPKAEDSGLIVTMPPGCNRQIKSKYNLSLRLLYLLFRFQALHPAHSNRNRRGCWKSKKRMCNLLPGRKIHCRAKILPASLYQKCC